MSTQKLELAMASLTEKKGASKIAMTNMNQKNKYKQSGDSLSNPQKYGLVCVFKDPTKIENE